MVDEAADALERSVFFEQLSAGYEDLHADQVAWSEIEAERAVESGVLPAATEAGETWATEA